MKFSTKPRNISNLTLTLVPRYLGNLKRLIYHKTRACTHCDPLPEYVISGYKVWATIEQRLYQRKIRDIHELLTPLIPLP